MVEVLNIIIKNKQINIFIIAKQNNVKQKFYIKNFIMYLENYLKDMD